MKRLSLIVAALALLSSFAFGGEKGLTTSFTVVVPTDARDKYGAPYQLSLGSTPVDELGTLIDQFNVSSNETSDSPTTTLSDPTKPVDVIVVVPRNTPQENINEFRSVIEAQIKTRYPKAKVEVRLSYVDVEADSEALRDQARELREMSHKFQPNAPEQQLIRLGQDQVEKGLRENELFKANWAKRLFKGAAHPSNTVIVARAVASLKFGMSAGFMISKWGLNPGSIMIASLQGLVSAAFGFNAAKWRDISAKHMFPWFKETSVVKFYNDRGWLKSANVNFFRSLGITYVFRTLLWASGAKTAQGETAPNPYTMEFFAPALASALPEVILDGFLDDASVALQAKGYLDGRTGSYLLWTIGMIDTFMQASLRAGLMDAWKVFNAVSIGGKTLTIAAGKFLPARTPRILLISADLQTKGQTQLRRPARNFLERFFNDVVLSLPDMVRAIGFAKRDLHVDSDRTLVERSLGIADEINIGAYNENVAGLFDLGLTYKDFAKSLNLTDRTDWMGQALWKMRQETIDGKLPMPTPNCNPLSGWCSCAFQKPGSESVFK